MLLADFSQPGLPFQDYDGVIRVGADGVDGVHVGFESPSPGAQNRRGVASSTMVWLTDAA